MSRKTLDPNKYELFGEDDPNRRKHGQSAEDRLKEVGLDNSSKEKKNVKKRR